MISSCRRSWLSRSLFAAGVLVAGASVAAGAQRPDSARAGIARRAPAPDTAPRSPADTLRPPLTPRRAFLYSFLAPGYSQSVFGRHKAATIMLLVEGVSLAMIRESGADVAEARRMARDSIVVSYTAAADSARPVYGKSRFDADYVKVRRGHLEDWLALLVGNHLFSGADAFVAANLWDVPAQLAVRPAPRGGATVSASISW